MKENKDKTKETVSVNFYLDTRRKKDNGFFPVKIRVYDATIKKARLYSTDFDLTEKDFKRILFPELGQRFKNDEKEIKEDLESILKLYKKKIDSINSFTFEALEDSLSVKSGELIDSFYQYRELMNELKQQDRISTASSYELSMKALKNFIKDKKGKEPKKLLFQEITIKFLEDFENWMIKKSGKTSTTVGIYLRGLRVIFNRAIDSKAIDKEIYPFGAKKFEIPASTKVKKSFDNIQLATLFNAIPKTPEQQKAKDFWFFSFVCNGMNLKDILYLRWENIQDGQIIFYREKTKRTKKGNLKPIQVPLTEFANTFLETYGTNEKEKKGLIFPILNDDISAEKAHAKKMNFIRFVNQHLKKLAKDNGLTEDISSYYARHSFATTAIRKKASMEYVSEALGHADLKTTNNYFAGFEDKTKKEMMHEITDFMR